jgi:hypothetical protein
MLPVDAITHKPDSFAYPWSLFISSWRVSLVEYNWVLRVCSTLLQVIGADKADHVCENLMGSERISLRAVIEII